MRRKILFLVVLLFSLSAMPLYSEHINTCDVFLEEELELSEAERAAFKDMAQKEDVWWKRWPSLMLGQLFMWSMRGYYQFEALRDALLKKLSSGTYGTKKKKFIKA